MPDYNIYEFVFRAIAILLPLFYIVMVIVNLSRMIHYIRQRRENPSPELNDKVNKYRNRLITFGILLAMYVGAVVLVFLFIVWINYQVMRHM